MVNVTIKPMNQSIGEVNQMRPLNIVNSQLNTLTPVGTAMTAVIIPKNAFTLAPAPMVKKWCNQTKYESRVIAINAKTIDVYPNKRLRENVATISEKIPKAGKTKIYTSG